jgi:hypothetical protein
MLDLGVTPLKLHSITTLLQQPTFLVEFLGRNNSASVTLISPIIY